MFIVRFVRKDGKPDEEYYYHTLQEAEAHKKLFDDDDSDLYERIEKLKIVTIFSLNQPTAMARSLILLVRTPYPI